MVVATYSSGMRGVVCVHVFPQNPQRQYLTSPCLEYTREKLVPAGRTASHIVQARGENWRGLIGTGAVDTSLFRLFFLLIRAGLIIVCESPASIRLAVFGIDRAASV